METSEVYLKQEWLDYLLKKSCPYVAGKVCLAETNTAFLNKIFEDFLSATFESVFPRSSMQFVIIQ